MITVPQNGAAILLGGTATNPIKVLVFGDTATAPNNNQPANVLTVRAANGQPICERTRSGMILQTPTGKNGTIVVNGVTINPAGLVHTGNDVTAGSVSLKTHTHGGVDTGTGNTQGPNS